jgi:hypothetical protein
MLMVPSALCILYVLDIQEPLWFRFILLLLFGLPSAFVHDFYRSCSVSIADFQVDSTRSFSFFDIHVFRVTYFHFYLL